MPNYQSYIQGFLTRAEAVLKAHEELTSRGLVRLSGTPTQFDITNAYLDVTLSMLEGMVETYQYPNLKLVITQISRDYRSAKGYSSTADDRLMEYAGITASTLKRNRTVMVSAGLWGKVSGDGHTANRYFPLLTEAGYQAFVKLVEDAKNGIHPLYGPVTPNESVEGEEPQSKPTEAPSPVIEAVEAPSEQLHEYPTQFDVTEPVVASEPVVVPEPETPVSVPANRTAEINPVTGRPFKIAKPKAPNIMTKREREAMEQAAIRKAKEQAPDVLTNGSGIISRGLPEGTRVKRTYSESM